MTVSISNDTLQINNFKTREQEIVDYFSKLSDNENSEEKLEMLLKLGILTQNTANTAMSAKYVETVFEDLKERLTNNVDRLLDQDGDLAHMLDKHLGKNGTVKDVLDPDIEGTPLNRLRTALYTELSEIKDVILKKEGYEDAAKKGTQKGGEFENRCDPYLRSTAEYYSDTVEHTAGNKGNVGDSRKGDFVITLGDTEKRIVFEMKHQKSLGIPAIKKELDDAMKNRNADYGVMVSRNKDAIPKEVGWFNQYGKDKLVCSVSESDEDEEHMWIIKVAYQWARLSIESDGYKTFGADPDIIARCANKIEESLKRLKKVIAKCNSITTYANDIEIMMKDEEKKIEDGINDIIHSLNRSE